jgi:HlyD family secretion protein
MDKPRTGQAEKRRIRRMILFAVLAIVIGGVTVGISQIKPAAQSVERDTLLTGKVERGPMLREVRGPGQLVPIDIRWVSAPIEGRVERIPSLPGVTVTPDTVIMELSNPEIEQNAFEAESNLRSAEADLKNLEAQLASSLLNQQAQVASAESQAEQEKLQVEANERMYNEKLIPEITLKLSKLKYDQLTKQVKIERERYIQAKSSNAAQLSSQRAKVEQLRALYELRRRQVEYLKVRSGIPGVLQEVPVQVGQRAPAGTNLARVAQPDRLKAELRIPETQAKDVKLGMKVSIDTRPAIIPGHVIRIAPSSTDGAVTMDVALDGPLPPGARPNLQVDGTVELERLSDVLYVGRPNYGQPNSQIEVFKLVDGGKEATRVPVQFGRMSVSTIEVVNGLKVGDEIILSDTAQYDGADRIRLN